MDANRVASLTDLARRARELDEQSIVGNVSSHFIEIVDSGSREVCVRANREGLVHIARLCLSLASQGHVGSHHHLDEAGLADRCDRTLVLTFVDSGAAKRG